MKLYGSARSSAAFRVRIALHLKGVPWTWVPVRLSAAEHREEGFTALNPAQLVPLLVDGPHRLTQSLAIIEYIERTQPGPALLPADPVDCAYVRACALAVACEVHPLNNLRALDYLRQEAGLDEAAVGRWYAHWIDDGLHKLEVLLADQRRHGRFLLGDTPTMACTSSRCCWPTSAGTAASCSATRRRWPTRCWCRRSSTRNAGAASSARFRG